MNYCDCEHKVVLTRAHPLNACGKLMVWFEHTNGDVGQCFSTFVRRLPGKLFFHKTRARSQQIYS